MIVHLEKLELCEVLKKVNHMAADQDCCTYIFFMLY